MRRQCESQKQQYGRGKSDCIQDIENTESAFGSYHLFDKMHRDSAVDTHIVVDLRFHYVGCGFYGLQIVEIEIVLSGFKLEFIVVAQFVPDADMIGRTDIYHYGRENYYRRRPRGFLSERFEDLHLLRYAVAFSPSTSRTK